MKSMKNRILDHFGLKLLSLLIAIVIWIVVANVDDSKTTRQISGIEIEFINGEAITEQNMVYEVPNGTTIDIVVKGRRKIVESLTSQDFRAVADLSKMSLTNAVNVVVTATSIYNARELSISYPESAVNVALEKKIESQLAITVRTNNEVAEGYAIRSKTPTPNLITVKGAESVIDMINEVVVDVDVRGANSNLSATAEPIFLSKSGDVIDSAKFEYDVTTVDVNIEVDKTKELAVRVKTKGEPKDGYMVSAVDYQPTTILVVGDSADLAKVEEVVIDDIDVSDISEDMETSVEIADYLPDELAMADSTQEIMVKVAVEKLEEKNMILTSDSISIVGKNSNYSYRYIGNDSFSLKVKGLKDNLDALKISSLLPSIDVTDYEPGTYNFTVTMKEISGIEVMGEITVQVEIVENDN